MVCLIRISSLSGTPVNISCLHYINKRCFHLNRNASVTVGDDLGGVRPSSGAATLERQQAPMKSDAFEYPVLAAPEDGRTPITLMPAVTDALP